MDSPLSLHSSGSTSSRFILSQAKKPSGATTAKSNGTNDINDVENYDGAKVASNMEGVNDSIDADITSNESDSELRVQLKELRMELERQEAEAKDLQVT